MAGVDVEHGHGAVGGAVTRHQLLRAHVRGVQGLGGRRGTPGGAHVGRRRGWHQS